MVMSRFGEGLVEKQLQLHSPELVQEIAASEAFKRPALVRAHAAAAERAGRRHLLSSSASSKASVRSLKQDPSSSSRSSDDLIPIHFPELRLGIVHHGFVVSGTLCVPAYHTFSSICTILGDDDGRAVKLTIYNGAPSTWSVEDVQLVFHQGARIAVREPYFRRFADGTVGLRVKNPSDVIFLTKDDDIAKALLLDEDLDYAELRVRGNNLFANGDWWGAAKLYSKSISLAERELDYRKQAIATQNMIEQQRQSRLTNSCLHRLTKNPLFSCSQKEDVVDSSSRKPTKLSLSTAASWSKTAADVYNRTAIKVGLVTAYSNRAEALLRMRRYKAALSDAKAALAIDPLHVKSLYRKGSALLALGAFREAVDCLQVAVKLAPNSHHMQRALEESKMALRQSRGEFDFSKFFQSGFSDKPPCCVDYVGPVKVGFSSLRDAGRGLFVTKDVGVGELLLVSNALAVARCSDRGTRRDAIEDLVRQLYGRAKTSENMLSLTQLLNCMFNGTQRSGRWLPRDGLLSDQHVSSPRKGTEEHVAPVDVEKIRRIVQWNSLADTGFRFRHKNAANLPDETRLGVWFLPSFINHSCCPNASRIHVGDALLIRAARDLKAGEEVFFPYFGILCPLGDRRQIYSDLGFLCSCPRCLLEESLESSLRGATELVRKVSEDLRVRSHYIKPAVHECNKIEKTISGLGILKRMWIRASFTVVFSLAAFATDLENRAELVNAMHEAVFCVDPGDPQTLKLAATIAKERQLVEGTNSEAYKRAEATAFYICSTIFGKQNRRYITDALIRACCEGLFDA